MHYAHLIFLSDFLQGLNSARKFYTKNYYFSKHNLFYTNSLLQEQRWNPRNYFKQELIMNIFVWTNNHDMNMQAKIHSVFKYRDL
jgi:hypothetical protein